MEGKLEGKLEGKQEGRQEEALHIARSLLEQGFERELVRMTIGLSDDDLNAFRMHPSRWGKINDDCRDYRWKRYHRSYNLSIYWDICWNYTWSFMKDFRKVNEKRHCVLLVHVWNRDLSASWCRWFVSCRMTT